MILAALLLAAAPAQDVPAAPEEAEEIVVQATFGKATMLFDKGSDGKLRNCRIMVSTGSQRRDAEACRGTPVCYSGTADQVTECIGFAVVELGALADPRKAVTLPAAPAGSAYQVFPLSQMIRPAPPPPGAAGPFSGTAGSDEAEDQRVKLPPLPRDESKDPVIRITSGQNGDGQATPR